MERHSLASILSALADAQVRFLVCGGLAVVAHGYVRFTGDLDVAFDVEPANLGRAVAVLGSLGYRPRAPVDLVALLDAVQRKSWIEEKNLIALSLWSPKHLATEIDVIIAPVIDVVAALTRALTLEFAPGVTARVVALEDLIAMKRKAGRVDDLRDIEQLLALHGDRS